MSVRMMPFWGGFHIHNLELFKEFQVGGNTYRVGLRPDSYPFYAWAPVINGQVKYDQAPFYVDKNGNLVATNAIISGKIITGSGSIIDGVYIKDASITNAKIVSLDAGKITTGYLSADRIASHSITADKLSVSQLSAISANLGNITAGTITGVTIQTGTPTGTNKVIRLNSQNSWLIDFLYGSNVIGNIECYYNPNNDLSGVRTIGGGGAILDVVGKSNMGFANFGIYIDSNNNGYFGIEWDGNDYTSIRLWGYKIKNGTMTDIPFAMNLIPYYTTCDLGNAINRWRNLYLSGTLYGGSIYTTSPSTFGTIYPDSSSSYNLGSSSYYWNNLYLNYLRFNPSYGRIYWGSDIVLDIGVPNSACMTIGKHLYPSSTAAQINLGTTNQYFNAIYANYLYYHTGYYQFDKYDDIELLKRIDVKNPETFPPEVTKEGFYNLGAFNGFIIGVLKQLIKKVEELEKRIK